MEQGGREGERVTQVRGLKYMTSASTLVRGGGGGHGKTEEVKEVA